MADTEPKYARRKAFVQPMQKETSTITPPKTEPTQVDVFDEFKKSNKDTILTALQKVSESLIIKIGSRNANTEEKMAILISHESSGNIITSADFNKGKGSYGLADLAKNAVGLKNLFEDAPLLKNFYGITPNDMKTIETFLQQGEKSSVKIQDAFLKIADKMDAINKKQIQEPLGDTLDALYKKNNVVSSSSTTRVLSKWLEKFENSYTPPQSDQAKDITSTNVKIPSLASMQNNFKATLNEIKDNLNNLFNMSSKSEAAPEMPVRMQHKAADNPYKGMERIPLVEAFMEKALNVKQRLETNPNAEVSSDLKDLQSMRNQMQELEKKGRDDRQPDWKTTQNAGVDMSSVIASIKCLAGDDKALEFREEQHKDKSKEKTPSITSEFDARMNMLTEKIDKMAENDLQSSARLGPN